MDGVEGEKMEDWESGLKTDQDKINWLIDLIYKRKKTPHYVISRLSMLKRRFGDKDFVRFTTNNKLYMVVFPLLNKYTKLSWKDLDKLIK